MNKTLIDCTKSTFYAMSEPRGVTLIALIVTIIVLLILAGVTIANITGVDSTIDKAEQAKDENAIQAELEEIQSAIANASTKGIRHGNFSGSADASSIKSVLKSKNLIKENPDEVIAEGQNTWIVSGRKTNKKYKIKSDGSVEKYISILPDDFQQVEYIESTETQCIDLGVSYSSSKTKINVVGTCTSLSSGGSYNCFPQILEQNSYFGVALRNSDQYPKGRLLMDSVTEFDFTPEFEKIYNIVLDKKILYVDGIQKASTKKNKTFSLNMYIFARNKDNEINNSQNVKLYKLQIYENDIIIRDFIPCYCSKVVTNVDGEECNKGTIGLYDIVENKFYTNKGTGTFLKGEDVY